MRWRTSTTSATGPASARSASELGVQAFGVNAIVLPPGIETGRHFHDEQEELYFVHAGRVEMEFGDGSRHELGPGGLARVDPATCALVRNRGDEDAVYVIVGAKDGYVGRDGRVPEGEENRARPIPGVAIDPRAEREDVDEDAHAHAARQRRAGRHAQAHTAHGSPRVVPQVVRRGWSNATGRPVAASVSNSDTRRSRIPGPCPGANRSPAFASPAPGRGRAAQRDGTERHAAWPAVRRARAGRSGRRGTCR